MPSERSSSWLELLRSQGLGVICGQATVLLLGIGSFVLAHSDDVRAPPMDDVTTFFSEPSSAYVWFYLLLGVLAVYALNTVLCTWDSVISRWRAGQRALASYGPAVMHVAFLIALLAHAVGGVAAQDDPPIIVGDDWQEIGGGRSGRVIRIEEDLHPDGSLAAVRATLDVRAPGGGVETEVLGYNNPISRGLGYDLWLILEQGHVPFARFSTKDGPCVAVSGGVCRFGDLELLVGGIMGHPSRGRFVSVRARGQGFTLNEGGTAEIAGYGSLALERIDERPRVRLRHRRAAGNPLALASALVLALGMFMMGRRWL